MKNFKKLMAFGLIALSASSIQFSADKANSITEDESNVPVVSNAGKGSVIIWAYCENSGKLGDYNKCEETINSLKPGLGLLESFQIKRRDPRKFSDVIRAEDALGLLAITGNRSLRAGVDVTYEDHHYKGDNINGLYHCDGPTKRPEYVSRDIDSTKATVVITSDIDIKDPRNRSHQTPYDGYSMDVVAGLQRSLYGCDLHHVYEKFGRLMHSGAAINPKVYFPQSAKIERVDFTSSAAIL